MNMSEIESIEAKLPVGMRMVLSGLERERLIAGARRERNEQMADSFFAAVEGVKSFVREVRRIAVACTAARLRRQIV